MKGFPTELIYILLVGAALLFNFLMRRAARRGPPEVAQDEALPEEIPEEVWGRTALTQIAMPEPVVVREPARRAAAPAASPVRPLRRFAGRSLLGTRRDVQNGIVVAAILGRCRADEQHEIR